MVFARGGSHTGTVYSSGGVTNEMYVVGSHAVVIEITIKQLLLGHGTYNGNMFAAGQV